jgi:hypothetical protein
MGLGPIENQVYRQSWLASRIIGGIEVPGTYLLHALACAVHALGDLLMRKPAPAQPHSFAV